MKPYWIAVAAVTLLANPALAAGTVVKVTLWDKGPTSLDKIGQGPGARQLARHGPMLSEPMTMRGRRARREPQHVLGRFTASSKLSAVKLLGDHV